MSNIADSLKEFINVAGLAAKIKALEAELTVLKSLQSSLGVKPRGRKPGTKVAAKAPKAKAGKKAKRSKRGSTGESIMSFLASKGKDGAHVKDIASHVGIKPVNVTSYLYTTGKSKTKKVAPATFAVKE